MRFLFTVIALVFSMTLMNAQNVQPGANVTDAAGLKQGRWTITAAEKNASGYPPEQIIEEGYYVDGRKDGIWKKYYSGGKLEHQLTFKNNKLHGKAIFYYKNGKVKEEGIWKKNRWVGEYKYYYKNGNLRNEWKYNETGKRTGVQRYYHENGKLKIEGAWENGKESGAIVEFYEDGSVKSERFFAGGKLDAVKSKKYTQAEKSVSTVAPSDSSDSLKAVAKVVPKKVFNPNGYNQVFDKNGRIIKDGTFSNGFFRNGKSYEYNAEGKLRKTSFVKNGKVIRVVRN